MPETAEDIREVQVLHNCAQENIVGIVETFKQGSNFYLIINYQSMDLGAVIDK